jgi:hypothetical protein
MSNSNGAGGTAEHAWKVIKALSLSETTRLFKALQWAIKVEQAGYVVVPKTFMDFATSFSVEALTMAYKLGNESVAYQRKAAKFIHDQRTHERYRHVHRMIEEGHVRQNGGPDWRYIYRQLAVIAKDRTGLDRKNGRADGAVIPLSALQKGYRRWLKANGIT